jgi:hypothetical protein
MDPHQEWSFGTNRAAFEPPDLLIAQFRGVADVESARWSVGLYRELAARQPFYLLADITDSRHTSASRKYLVEHTRPEWFRGIVYIGAGYEQRAATKGFMVSFLMNGSAPYETQYLDTVEQARTWVAQHRAKVQRAPERAHP